MAVIIIAEVLLKITFMLLFSYVVGGNQILRTSQVRTPRKPTVSSIIPLVPLRRRRCAVQALQLIAYTVYQLTLPTQLYVLHTLLK